MGRKEGGGARRFSTPTNVGINPQNFLTFSFTPFPTVVKKFKVIPSASQSQVIKLEPRAPPQKVGYSGQILTLDTLPHLKYNLVTR